MAGAPGLAIGMASAVGLVMLIVARRKGQRVVIGDDIEIVVTELSRTTVKLGITAPHPYSILRGEIKESIAQANREAMDAERVRSAELPAEATESAHTVDVALTGPGSFFGASVKNVAPSIVNLETPK
jgi:carbon storage regulator